LTLGGIDSKEMATPFVAVTDTLLYLQCSRHFSCGEKKIWLF